MAVCMLTLQGYEGDGITCKLVDCGEVPVPLNGIVSQCLIGAPDRGETEWEARCLYECDTGYEATNLAFSESFCGGDGLWQSTLPDCVAKNCGPLASVGVPLSGQSELSGKLCQPLGTSYPTRCVFSCPAGLELSPLTTAITCESTGLWAPTDKSPLCVDTDECSDERLHECPPKSVCQNTYGSYACTPYIVEGSFVAAADIGKVGRRTVRSLNKPLSRFLLSP